MKLKILSFVLVCLLLLVDCGTKFNDAKASSIIKEAFEFTKEDTLRDLETFLESENIALVKFKLNRFELSAKIRRYVDSGWQLDEIQTYKLGEWISAEDAIKWFNEYREEKRADQRARKEQPQRYAMKDIAVIAKRLWDYYTDKGIMLKQDGIYDENSEFYQTLSPFYTKRLPINDPWGNNYRVYLGGTCLGKYGITKYGITGYRIAGLGFKNFMVVSFGADGDKESWKFNPSDPEAGLIVMKTADDFDIDLIMWAGSWIRAPRTTAAPSRCP